MERVKNLRTDLAGVHGLLTHSAPSQFLGIVVIAGDISPIDVISHIPGVCEDASIPYCYTPSKDDLGAVTGSKRTTCTVMIKPSDNYKDSYDNCFTEVQYLPNTF